MQNNLNVFGRGRILRAYMEMIKNLLQFFFFSWKQLKVHARGSPGEIEGVTMFFSRSPQKGLIASTVVGLLHRPLVPVLHIRGKRWGWRLIKKKFSFVLNIFQGLASSSYAQKTFEWRIIFSMFSVHLVYKDNFLFGSHNVLFHGCLIHPQLLLALNKTKRNTWRVATLFI